MKKEKKHLKSKTTTVKATVTYEQKKILQKFIGILGSNEQDVVSKILTLWLYNEQHLKLNNTKSENEK